MGKNDKRVDLSRVVASPVLTGTSKTYIWTGVVRAEKIDSNLISDDKKREAFKALVERFEELVISYRENENQNSILLINKPTDRFMSNQGLESQILNIGKHIKDILNNPNNGIDMDLFWLYLCREYEEILIHNPEEFNHMASDARKTLELFRNSINRNGIRIREIYQEDKKHYVSVPFLTKTQEKSLPNANKNRQMLVELLECVSGTQNISIEEGTELLRELSTGLLISDLLSLIEDPHLVAMEYISMLKNYLLSIGWKMEEIEALSTDELEKIALDKYNTSGIEAHRVLMSQTIIDLFPYIDMENLYLLIASRTLLSYADMKLDGLIFNNEDDRDESDIIVKTPEEEIHESGRICERLDENSAITKMRRTEEIVNKILSMNAISKKKRVKIYFKDSETWITLSKVQDLMRNYCDGIYLNEVMEIALAHKALMNPSEIELWSDELITRMNFNKKDLVLLSLVNLENLKRFAKCGKLSKEDIFDIVTVLHEESFEGTYYKDNYNLRDKESVEIVKAFVLENSPKLLKTLLDEGIISVEDLKVFYDKRLVNLGDLESLKEGRPDFSKQMADNIDVNELLKRYKEYIEQKLRYENALKKNDPDAEVYKEMFEFSRKEKDSLMLLFKKYKLDGLSEEEKNELAEEMLMSYCLEFADDNEELINESLRELYKDGIVSFENVRNTDEYYLQTVLIDVMLVRGELTLDDTKMLRETMPYNTLINIITSAISNSSITETEKFTLIMNVFHMHTPEDEKARRMLFKKLNLSKYDGSDVPGIKKIEEDELVVPGTKGKGTKDPAKEYVYPQHIKWEFLNALDKDAIITVYSNGYVEAYSKKLNVRIIEKYFEIGERGFSEFKDAYGVSTFILSDETYRENEDLLIETFDGKNNVINRKVLSAIVPRKDRVRHNTHSQDKNWMRNMARYFGIDLETDLELVQDSRYSKEELEVIRETIKSYENLYVER